MRPKHYDLLYSSFEEILRCFTFTTVPHDSLNIVAGAPIMQEVSMTIHSFLQSDTPKRSRTPFVATGQTAYIVIIQSYAHNFRAHVMKQEVRIWMNCLTTQPRKAGSVQQYRTTWFCVQGGYMAEMALRLIKFCSPLITCSLFTLRRAGTLRLCM